MLAHRVPLQPRPQEMEISLGGTAYKFRTHWCVPSNCWLLDILDQLGNRILSSVPLVTGGDLLGQFGYLEFKGMLLVWSSDGPWDTVPSFTSLGGTGNLYYVPEA